MRRLICALALVIAAPAWAQSSEEEPTAAPGSIAIGMIETANADGVFELVHNGQVTLRHVGSGLICHFARNGDGGRIVLYPNLQRGDDVSCDMNDGREYITLYATRFPFGTTLDEQIAGAEASIRHRFPDAQSLPVNTAPATPFSRTTQFIVMREGERMLTHASITRIGDWIIKLRYSVRAPDDAAARQGETAAARLFEATIAEINAPPTL